MSETQFEAAPSSASAIEEIAAAWVRRRHFWDWTDQNQAELDAWINEQPAHEVAYLRLEAAWERTERLAALRPSKPGRAAGGSSNWKSALRVAAGIVFVAALSAGGINYYLSPKGTLYITPVGGQRTLTLSDGSRIELNTDTALRLDPDQRSAVLERGEAYFSIQHNAAHPFSVTAANHRIVDVGTVFVVRQTPGQTRVTLVEGEARLEAMDAQTHRQTALLTPGDVAVATREQISVSREPAHKLDKEFGWRRGLLTFDNATLADAARELNRYNARKLVVADTELGRTHIDATIPINGVEAFARIARDAMGANIRMRGDEVILSSGSNARSGGN